MISFCYPSIIRTNFSYKFPILKISATTLYDIIGIKINIIIINLLFNFSNLILYI